MISHHIHIIKFLVNNCKAKVDPGAGPLAAGCLVLTSPQPSHIKMFRRKGCQAEIQGHTYRCPQQHDICLLQGAWDAICPHVPSGFPVKHQGKDPKGEDGSSKAEGFPATLSPVAKYLLGQNQNEYKYWVKHNKQQVNTLEFC